MTPRPATPSLFVVGDSISIDYHPYLEKLAVGRFGYARKGGIEEARQDLDAAAGANGGDSSRVRAYLTEVLSGELAADHVVVNCGLHDIKRAPTPDDPCQVPLATYEDNIRAIVALVTASGRGLFWITTTPLNEGWQAHRPMPFHRLAADLDAYNAAAARIMQGAGVPMIDLHAFTRDLGDDSFRDHVHFTPETSARQAAYLVGWFEAWFAR